MTVSLNHTLITVAVCPEVLTINGKAELIVPDAAAYAETIDAIRGIQRGLDSMKASPGNPARQALEDIRAKYQIPGPKNNAVKPFSPIADDP